MRAEKTESNKRESEEGVAQKEGGEQQRKSLKRAVNVAAVVGGVERNRQDGVWLRVSADGLHPPSL